MGHLEFTVMEALWDHGPATVHDAMRLLTRPLAYNTVMTTLDRLYKKGLLRRERQDRAYLYSAAPSRVEWQRRQAEQLVSEFLASAGAPGELLVSCLVDAVGRHDAALLDDLEERIRRKRIERETAP